MSFVSFALKTPEAAHKFIEGLFHSTLSFFEWREMMSCVKIVAVLKAEYSSVLSAGFWSPKVLQETLKTLQSSPECFLPVCKLLAMFMQDCPNEHKALLLSYILSSYNCYVNAGLEMGDDHPSQEEVATMEKEFYFILQCCCSVWQSGAMALFHAMTMHPVCNEQAAISMIVKSSSVDQIVRLVFDQAVADLAKQPVEAANSYRSILYGMGLAYISVCHRGSPSLPKFVADLRAQIPLGPSDPAFNFGCDKVAYAVLLGIETPAYSDEICSLLSECFAKTTPFEVDEKLNDLLSEAVKYGTGMSRLQKIFIAAHCPMLVPHLAPYLESFNETAKETGSESEKYITVIRKLLSQAEHQQPPQKQIKQEEPPPSYEQHQQQQQQQQQDPPPPSYAQSQSKQGPEPEEAPLGLPPSDMN